MLKRNRYYLKITGEDGKRSLTIDLHNRNIQEVSQAQGRSLVGPRTGKDPACKAAEKQMTASFHSQSSELR